MRIVITSKGHKLLYLPEESYLNDNSRIKKLEQYELNKNSQKRKPIFQRNEDNFKYIKIKTTKLNDEFVKSKYKSDKYYEVSDNRSSSVMDPFNNRKNKMLIQDAVPVSTRNNVRSVISGVDLDKSDFKSSEVFQDYKVCQPQLPSIDAKFQRIDIKEIKKLADHRQNGGGRLIFKNLKKKIGPMVYSQLNSVIDALHKTYEIPCIHQTIKERISKAETIKSEKDKEIENVCLDNYITKLANKNNNQLIKIDRMFQKKLNYY